MYHLITGTATEPTAQDIKGANVILGKHSAHTWTYQYQNTISGIPRYKKMGCSVCDGIANPQKIIMKGDLNGDNKVGAADATMAFRYVAQVNTSLNQDQKFAGDLNNTGNAAPVIRIADATRIFRYVAEITTVLSPPAPGGISSSSSSVAPLSRGGSCTVKAQTKVISAGTTTVTIDITTQNRTVPIDGFVFTVSYDPAKLAFVSGTRGATVPSVGSFSAAKVADESKVAVAFTGEDSITANGTLATLTFTVLNSTAGTVCDLIIGETDFCDDEMSSVAMTEIDGVIYIN